jgi:uncharacterized damage-inducible protein DinB
MLSKLLTEFFQRDLKALEEQLMAYKNEADIWKIAPGIANSAGNLCLHLTGNLNHFIGTALGNTGYVRQRDNEFTQSDIARESLVAELRKTSVMIESTLRVLSDKDMEKDFPFEKHGMIVSTGHMLLHIFGHFNYHLGQVNYHRRLLCD